MAEMSCYVTGRVKWGSFLNSLNVRINKLAAL